MVKLSINNEAIDQIIKLVKINLLIWLFENVIWSFALKRAKQGGNGQRANGQRLIWAIDLWSFETTPLIKLYNKGGAFPPRRKILMKTLETMVWKQWLHPGNPGNNGYSGFSGVWL